MARLGRKYGIEMGNYTAQEVISLAKKIKADNESAFTEGSAFSFSGVNDDYDVEEIRLIISGGDPIEKSNLSQSFFDRGGVYKRLITHYATLLTYEGILIPNKVNDSLQEENLIKQYNEAVNLLEVMDLKNLFTRIGQKALVNGTYYGMVYTKSKNDFGVVDLPFKYCRSRFQDEEGNPIIEFDVKYFSEIRDATTRQAALDSFPKALSDAYKRWEKDGDNRDTYYLLHTKDTLCFKFFDDYPPFLAVIQAILEYDKAVQVEQIGALEDIRKLFIQKIPHLNDGTLLFEPVEAQEMHNGAVNILGDVDNYSVVTTYADVEIADTKTSGDKAVTSTLERMKDNVYNTAGTSSQIFAATGNLSVATSLKNDLAFMMVLANKLATYVSRVMNKRFGGKDLNFTYRILPISWYNKGDMVSEYFKLATSGYSFTLPAIAQGISQRDLSSLKILENDILNLDERLVPLQTSYTQSGDTSGRPTLQDDEKSEKTLQNEQSLDNSGGE